jgi:hypothetical protein
MAKTVSELLNGADGELVKRYADSRVSQALKSFQERHPSDAELSGRLENLEAGFDAKIRAMQLENYTLRKAHEFGISPADIEDLGMTFRDERDVDIKLAKLGKKVQLKQTADIHRLIAENSVIPGSGNREDTTDSLREKRLAAFSPEERRILESSGEIDRLLR